MSRPDARAEIRLVSLRTVRGANFWSTRPVTRLDLAVGAYDEISSAEVPGLVEALVEALPGLREHCCSIGEPGGFVTRLRRGTYAPHVLEHVALELQAAVGHEVGYGRARGGDRPGEYTVVFEHRHAEVGLRAAGLALGIVQDAFAGAPGPVGPALTELEALARAPDAPPPRQRVLCGITGGGDRVAVRTEMLRRGVPPGEPVVEVAPAYLLNAGLPYARSAVAVILDAAPEDVPERYRDPERARRLVAVLADAVPPDGIVVAPAGEPEVQALARDAGCRVAVFAEGPVAAEDLRVAHAVASVREGRIVLECRGERSDRGPLRPGAPAGAQVAAALAVHSLEELTPELLENDAAVR